MFSKRITPFFQGAIRNMLIIFIVLGIGAVIYGYQYDNSILALGILVMLITVSSLSAFYGIQIDYNHQRYKSYFSVLGIKIGKWQPLPLIGKIVLAPRKRFMRRSSVSSDIYNEIFLIKLIPAEADEAIIASMGLYGDLVLEADTLSKELGVPVAEDFK